MSDTAAATQGGMEDVIFGTWSATLHSSRTAEPLLATATAHVEMATRGQRIARCCPLP